MRNIKKIMISLVLMIAILFQVTMQKAEAAKPKVNSKSVTVETYDEFWTQFYKLIGDGYNEMKISIQGEDAELIKNEIDEDEDYPFFIDSDHAEQYMDKANWKTRYLLDLFVYEWFYKFDPGEQDYIEENYYFEDEIIYKDGLVDITNLDKKMYYELNGEYYLYDEYSYLWDYELYYGEEHKYAWNEETQELTVGLELDAKKNSGVDYTFDHNNVLKTFDEVKKLVKSWKMENMTDYQRISKVNKYICDHVTYSSNPDLNPGRGSNAFLYGKAICNGYAELTDIFLKTMGYESVLIQVYDEDYDFNNDGHAWNIVKIDKKWYAIDTTWNDGPNRLTKYLLVSQTEMKDHNGWKIGNAKDYKLSTKRLSSNSKAKIKLRIN